VNPGVVHRVKDALPQIVLLGDVVVFVFVPRLHLSDRRTGYVFPSPRGGHYSSWRIQQIVKERAKDAEITKRVYPHLLRHTVAQRLADEGMPENLLQKFLGHENPQTTQVYYEPSRSQVKQAFEEAMQEEGPRFVMGCTDDREAVGSRCRSYVRQPRLQRRSQVAR